ncbi:transposase [Streptomyces sp. NPDC093261]|uniref:transposase n=1 Tax=Streptomyces sp. NPDC093261 TaxID=3366037 RepID=UPI0037FA5422
MGLPEPHAQQREVLLLDPTPCDLHEAAPGNAPGSSQATCCADHAQGLRQPTWKTRDVIRPEALIVDDTGFLEDADATPCVPRQYTGTAGKVSAGLGGFLASGAECRRGGRSRCRPRCWCR